MGEDDYSPLRTSEDRFRLDTSVGAGHPSIRFPSGDKGQVRGFDGHLVSSVAALNVPQGRSYWEFGTEADYKAKAKEGFR